MDWERRARSRGQRGVKGAGKGRARVWGQRGGKGGEREGESKGQ